MEVKGWRLKVGKHKVKIFDDKNELTDEEAMVLIKYLYDEGILSSKSVDCEIISK